MVQSIFGGLAALAGFVASLTTLVLLAASAPNSSPALGAALKALAVGTVGVGLASFVGSVAAFLIARQGAAVFIGSLPWAWGAVALIALTMVEKGRLDPTGGSLIARAIATLIFGGLGGMLLVVGVREMSRQAWLIRTADEVPAVVIEKTVHKSTSADTDRRTLRDNSTNSYEPIVRFRYTVDGVQHESTMLQPTVIVQAYPSEEGAAERIAAYEVGEPVTAHVARSRPTMGFLERRASLGPLIFTTLGIAVPPVVWAFARLVI